MHHIPIRVGLVGDVHATIATTWRAIRRLANEGVTDIHFLGDFGFLWDGSTAQKVLLDLVSSKLTEHGATAYVTGGNHEGYDEWAKIEPDKFGIRAARDNILLLPRGWRAVSPTGNIVASFGGANSVDMPARVRRGSGYWPAEQITEDDLVALGTDRVDILLGHDAPKAVSLAILLEPGQDRWEPEGVAYADQGQAMYQRAVEQVRPRLTVSGHYHLYLNVSETFISPQFGAFETRVVILNADGNEPTIAILNTDTLELSYPAF